VNSLITSAVSFLSMFMIGCGGNSNNLYKSMNLADATLIKVKKASETLENNDITEVIALQSINSDILRYSSVKNKNKYKCEAGSVDVDKKKGFFVLNYNDCHLQNHALNGKIKIIVNNCENCNICLSKKYTFLSDFRFDKTVYKKNSTIDLVNDLNENCDITFVNIKENIAFYKNKNRYYLNNAEVKTYVNDMNLKWAYDGGRVVFEDNTYAIISETKEDFTEKSGELLKFENRFLFNNSNALVTFHKRKLSLLIDDNNDGKYDRNETIN